MTMRQTLATAACALTLGLLAATVATAQTVAGQPCHTCDYHTVAPSPNPHDLSRIVKVLCPPALMGDCLKTAN